MNSVIQCLLHAPYLRHFFINNMYQGFLHSKSSKITKEMANLFKETKKLVKPFGLKKSVNKELPDFAGFDQCDA